MEPTATPSREEPLACSPRPLWRQLLVGVLTTVAIGSAILLGVAGHAAVVMLTDDRQGEGGIGPAFAFAYVAIVLASAAATLILSAGAVWLLVRRPRGTRGPIAPIWTWSPLRAALTALVLIVLLRVSAFGLVMLFGLSDNPLFPVFSTVLQWATLLGPLAAALLVIGMRRRIERVS